MLAALMMSTLCHQPGVAGWVHHLSENGIVATDGLFVLAASGQVWYLSMSDGWLREDASHDPPVPVSEIVWWHDPAFVTREGEGWVRNGSSWASVGQFPGAIDVPEAPQQVNAARPGNDPNPFGPSTGITIRTQQRVTGARISIFGSSGRQVRTIPIGDVQPIELTVIWDGRDDAGLQVPAGVYLYRLVHDGGASEAAKAVILR
jgi:hypothetical protein